MDKLSILATETESKNCKLETKEDLKE